MDGQQADVDDQGAPGLFHLGEPGFHGRRQRVLEGEQDGTAQQGPDQRFDEGTHDDVEAVAGQRDQAEEEERDRVVDALLQGFLVTRAEARQHVEEVIYRRTDVVHDCRAIMRVRHDDLRSCFPEALSSTSFPMRRRQHEGRGDPSQSGKQGVTSEPSRWRHLTGGDGRSADRARRYLRVAARRESRSKKRSKAREK